MSDSAQVVDWIGNVLLTVTSCHPTYLSPQAHVKLSTPGAFDGLRIHTDEINEVINRITPGTLTIAVVS